MGSSGGVGRTGDGEVYLRRSRVSPGEVGMGVEGREDPRKTITRRNFHDDFMLMPLYRGAFRARTQKRTIRPTVAVRKLVPSESHRR